MARQIRAVAGKFQSRAQRRNCRHSKSAPTGPESPANPAIVGSAEEVAEDLISRVEETDIDGFNLSRIVTPESLEDFVELVVPILQERGAYKCHYRPGALREKLFAGGPLLPPSHPAAAHRRSPGNGQ